MACIVNEGDALSLSAAQAAVWMHTDQLTFAQMDERFDVTEAEWADARSVYSACATAQR